MLEDLPLNAIRTLLLPMGDSVYTTRALVENSWLTYRDALPPDDGSWADLNDEVLSNILYLAEGLTKMHRNMREHWKHCDESPFVVSRWWDPTASDGFETGSYCLFRFEGKTANQLMDSLPRKLPLKLSRVSERSPHFVTATMTVEQHTLMLSQDMNDAGLGRAAAAA